MSEKTKNFYTVQQNASEILNPTSLFMEHYSLFTMSYPLTQKLVVFMNEFVRVSSELSMVFLLIFGCFGILTCFILAKILHTMMKEDSDHFFHTRMLMNYIPLELLDRNEVLRSVVLYNQFSNVVLDKISSSKRRGGNRSGGSVESSYAGICNITNANVDGTIIVNKLGEVELCNAPALRMFGLVTTDILGSSVYNLFEEGKYRELVKATIGSVASQTKSADTTCQEMVEVECLRRNNNKFPSTLSVFTCYVQEKGVIVVISIKDTTSEKKQQTLLAEEKKNSEKLLQNILPESVATKLKKGETFIAETFGDISCFFVSFKNVY